MKRTVFAKISVNDEVNNGQVLDTLESYDNGGMPKFYEIQ